MRILRLSQVLCCSMIAGVVPVTLSHAEIVTLWQDDGNGTNVTGAYTSKYGGFHTVSAGTIVADPTNGTHGGVHALNLNGTNGTSTEWANLRIDASPYEIEDGVVWDDRIVPGETTYSYTAQFYIPNDTTMSGNDVVYLLLRFYSENGQFSDGNHISITSDFYNANDSGSWIYAKAEGVIPAVDDVGEPIAKVDVRLPFSDFLTNAADGIFVYVDNIKLTVDLPPVADLPPHPVVLNPSTEDADASGYPDVWEALYGGYGLVPELDADGDGVSNADEASALTDPYDSDSRLSLEVESKQGGGLELVWPDITDRPNIIQTSTDLGQTDPWTPVSVDSTMDGNEHHADITTGDKRFYRALPTEPDVDSDGVADWIEPYFGFQSGSGAGDSSGQSKSYDTDGDGTPDVTVSGDLATYNEVYSANAGNVQLTEAQAARFLMQATFGPTYTDIEYVRTIGVNAWIDEQVSLPASYTRPYIELLKADVDAGVVDPELGDYPGQSDFVRGLNFRTIWGRNAIGGQDQLRQRVAWALSQILVASSAADGLGNQPRAVADYYDQFIDAAFGSFEDLLFQVSLHPLMGNYLSSIGNQKADESIDRYPDENYAREIMQLFSIGLWELNLDGTRKLDLQGEPIPTYGNFEITELARVFTGVNYASSNFGGGWKDDDYYMTTPMKVFPSEHDFGAKTLVNGGSIAAHADPDNATEQDGVDEVAYAVNVLVNHPNTAPFICRQLIQFLVSSNPSPAYVSRVASVFQDDGAGVVGNMEAVVRAILLDTEARDPMQHLSTAYFGKLREPVTRTMHLARVMNLDRFPNLMWWDWGDYVADSLQSPMGAPSVFNYYRPDFRMRGPLAENELDSPVFGITDSYAAIAFPNRLWTITLTGFKNGNDYHFQPDWSQLDGLASDIPALIDRCSLLFCAGTMTAGTRDILTTVLSSTSDLEERIELAVYLTLISPEGACLK